MSNILSDYERRKDLPPQWKYTPSLEDQNRRRHAPKYRGADIILDGFPGRMIVDPLPTGKARMMEWERGLYLPTCVDIEHGASGEYCRLCGEPHCRECALKWEAPIGSCLSCWIDRMKTATRGIFRGWLFGVLFIGQFAVISESKGVVVRPIVGGRGRWTKIRAETEKAILESTRKIGCLWSRVE